MQATLMRVVPVEDGHDVVPIHFRYDEDVRRALAQGDPDAWACLVNYADQLIEEMGAS